MEKSEYDAMMEEMMEAARTPTMKALVDKVYRPYHIYMHEVIIPQTAANQNVTEPCSALVNMVTLMIITMTEAAQRGEPTYEGVLEFYNRFQYEIASLLRQKIQADFGEATEIQRPVKDTQH